MGEGRCVLYVAMMHQLKAWQVASMSRHGCEHVTASLLHVLILSVSVQNYQTTNGVLAILYCTLTVLVFFLGLAASFLRILYSRHL